MFCTYQNGVAFTCEGGELTEDNDYDDDEHDSFVSIKRFRHFNDDSSSDVLTSRVPWK